MNFIEKIQEINAQRSICILKCFGINEDIVEKAKSGIYADTAENRKKGRVGRRYGSDEIDRYIEREKRAREYSKSLDDKYEEFSDYIDNALKKHGYDIDTISKSTTVYGKSWYLKIRGGGFYNQQIRISDHSVGDKRLLNDPTIMYFNYKDFEDKKLLNEKIDRILEKLKNQNDIIKRRKEETNLHYEKIDKIRNDSKEFVEKLKKENKAIFNSNRTYQTLDQIKERHPDWEHISQNKENKGAFNYDYIRKISSNEVGEYNVREEYYEYLKQQNIL